MYIFEYLVHIVLLSVKMNVRIGLLWFYGMDNWLHQAVFCGILLLIHSLHICARYQGPQILSYFSAGKVTDSDWMIYPLLIFASGDVIWAPSGSFQSSCDLNMAEFPFDNQTCSLDFGNMVHVEATVRLFAYSDSVDLGFYVPSKEFRYHRISHDVGICSYFPYYGPFKWVSLGSIGYLSHRAGNVEHLFSGWT